MKNKLVKINSTLLFLMAILFYSQPSSTYAGGKIYGKSQTIDKEYKKYEKCRLKKMEVNMKDGEKDGFKCIFKRQLKGKDVTVFQPTAQCMSSFKCKREIQD